MNRDKKNSWSGYTLDEIRYRRLLTVAHGEIEKERLAQQFKSSTGSTSVAGIPVSPMALLGGSVAASGVIKKMLGALSYMDYAIVAFKVGQRLFDTIKLWRGKKTDSPKKKK
ncbi:MAG: hypothetical protein NC117_04355 [Pseudoflavonifractor sp.]|nr:hypothetical protein [Pseudoflavonifractor sp.]